jgi:citrate lyase subunit beta/citryl-CoA lyase
MARRTPDIRRTWLFGPGADANVHEAMLASGADVLIVDLEDFTPPERRPDARKLLPEFVRRCSQQDCLAAVRINHLDQDGGLDLGAAISAGCDIILYPMTERSDQIQELDAAIASREAALPRPAGETEIIPVCETALGVLDVRSIASASGRVTCAILGAEDLATDLCAERGPDATELDYARRRFVLDCRAARIEPIDAPYTYSDIEGAEQEARYSRRLGYLSKALVRPDHSSPLNAAFTPSSDEVNVAGKIVKAFEAARSQGEDRVLVDNQWVEVPTYRNACALIHRAKRLGGLQ